MSFLESTLAAYIKIINSFLIIFPVISFPLNLSNFIFSNSKKNKLKETLIHLDIEHKGKFNRRIVMNIMINTVKIL